LETNASGQIGEAGVASLGGGGVDVGVGVEEHELLDCNGPPSEGDHDDLFRGLSILHIACVFDQEQVRRGIR
jgi:hypothetical protein